MYGGVKNVWLLRRCGDKIGNVLAYSCLPADKKQDKNEASFGRASSSETQQQILEFSCFREGLIILGIYAVRCFASPAKISYLTMWPFLLPQDQTNQSFDYRKGWKKIKVGVSSTQ
ncbi:hypothetical protein ACH5RR_011349 [Cinchona calisaya]|uniref:Uncharacterized protein n=1 Tax=Cinchona calisaya TaxID=153742 RepID=A0ABD3A573_9GENT